MLTTSTEHDNVSTTTKRSLDEESQKRGKRMMGVLLGTISKFKTEATDPALLKQREIQARLADKLQEERALLAETMSMEREERVQRELEEKEWFEETTRLELEEAARQRRLDLANFLQTNTGQPRLFYLPAILTDNQQEVIERQCRQACFHPDEQ